MGEARAYYNEFDPFAAQWLRNLIDAGLISPGDVDERSIVDVQSADLVGYAQHHFFAGIGGWSLALRLAGWADDRPVWTGSCPCQPLSSAGKRKGHADERHLWPAFHGLIAERKPATVFGEQVASKDGREWFAAVQADLEAVGYACGAADLCAAGVGAPHIRQRLFWVANAASARLEIQHRQPGDDEPQQPTAERAGQAVGGVDDTQRLGWRAGRHDHRKHVGIVHNSASPLGGLADMQGERRNRGADTAGASGRRSPEDGGALGGRPGARHGGWNDADWLCCTDGKWRPVEPGTFPLAHGVPGRVGLLRGYGNAINPILAAQFIQAFSETLTTE